MRKRASAATAASLALALALAVSATAATGAPAPKTHHGARATLYATGLDNPTSFAWGDGAMFAGDSGNSETVPNGGLYVIKHHVATKLSTSLLFVGGVAFHNKVLYVSGGDIGGAGVQWQIFAMRGWNGVTFTHQKAIYTAPSGFQGFNGVAFGHNGRLYVGVDLGLLNDNDHGPASISPYVYDILSMNASGKKVKVFAKGIRQPWQLAFAAHSSSPFVSDLGQDTDATDPPDFILKVKAGQNYGFPKCNHTKGSKCKHFAKPFRTLKPHFDPMGIAVIGKKLYIGSYFNGNATLGEGALYTMSVKGGRLKPLVTGFPLATDALAAHDGKLYVGGTGANGGEVYQVKP